MSSADTLRGTTRRPQCLAALFVHLPDRKTSRSNCQLLSEFWRGGWPSEAVALIPASGLRLDRGVTDQELDHRRGRFRVERQAVGRTVSNVGIRTSRL